MEEVTHGVDEHPAGLAPALRLLKALRVQHEIEAVGKVIAEALGDCFGIAVLAARANFVTARGRVPGLIGPLYCGAGA